MGSPGTRHQKSAVVAAFAAFAACAVLFASCNSPVTPTAAPSPSAPEPTTAASAAPGASGVPSTPATGPTPTPALAGSFTAAQSDLRLPKALSRAVAFAAGDRILVAGGISGNATSAAVLALDPAAGTIASVGKLKHPVEGAAAGDLGGSSLVVGGASQAAGVWVQAVADTGGVTNVGALPRARTGLRIAQVGEELIIVGGSARGNVDTQVLGTTDGIQFRVVAKLFQGVIDPAVAAIGGKVYVIGGETGAGATSAVQIVDVANGTVAFGTPLPHPISRATALVIGGAILVLGGRRGRTPSSVMQRIDPTDGSIRTVGNLPYQVFDAAGVVLDGTGYLIGGEAKNPLRTIILVSPGP